ncbi:TerB family tellurite resistance protein [Shinella pollutisoli]|uniref:TerB family tellurite resistance protein n=1 Tax=Shinella pollutisoli TaxID=2250594 RepID=A0ABV7DDA0_9HYPH|nr:TerB family tellurite resistance protein [Shinella pollutisoli]
MFERLQQFLASLTSGDARPAFAADDPRVAVMALCIQVMEADGKVLDVEKATLRSRFKALYGLEEAELDALVAAGADAESEAIDFFRFTSELKRQLSEEQRIALIGLLWEIVYADGERSEMEDHAIWRIADLLGVSGRERIMKRQEAAGRAGAAEAQGEPDEG